MGLSRAQQPHSGTRGPGRDANVQSRNPQKERPKFLCGAFSLSFLLCFQIVASPLLAHGCAPPGWCHRESGGTCFCTVMCLTVILPWVIHPAEPSQQAFFSFPASQTTRENSEQTSWPQGVVMVRDCGTERLPGWGTNAAGLVGAQARANCPEVK